MTSFVGDLVLRRPQYHILCECEALVSLRYIYLDSFFSDSDDIKKPIVRPSGALVTQKGSFNLI